MEYPVRPQNPQFRSTNQVLLLLPYSCFTVYLQGRSNLIAHMKKENDNRKENGSKKEDHI